MAENIDAQHVHHENVFVEPTSTVGPRGGRPKRRGFDRVCAVCGDEATGFHYKAPSCEGCKGFFRRTVQGNHKYTCTTGKNSCPISKSTRTACQKCRYAKCLAVGMTPNVVLSERQRIVKRQMILESRNVRQMMKSGARNEQQDFGKLVDDADRYVMSKLNATYAKLFTRKSFSLKPPHANLELLPPFASLRLIDLLTASVQIVTEFVKQVPGFLMLSPTDGVTLLRSCSLAILCLRTALRYDPATDSFPLRQNYILNRDYANSDTALAEVTLPIFTFARNFIRLSLDQTELSLLFGILALQATKNGIEEPERVDLYRDTLLTAGMRYSKAAYTDDPGRWSTLLMMTYPLEKLVILLESKVFQVPLMGTHSIPMTLLQLFEEDFQEGH